MSGKNGLVLLSVLLVLSIALMADSGDRQQIRQVENRESLRAPLLSAACDFTKTNGTVSVIWGSTQANTGIYAYYDAAVCGPSSYPFEITEFSFTLDDIPAQTIWPAYVDIVVREPKTPGDPCSEPGTELCRFSVVADKATFAYPNVGLVSLPSSCCVTGPFFMGLEFTQGAVNTTPGIIWDDQTIPACEGWMLWTDGGWSDWSTWPPPPPPLSHGYPLYWIGGTPNSVNCGGDQCSWQPGDDHKMHFPQLPDETGWDVNATQPMVLADDFLCTQTGLITDIHFWGGWKGDVEGQIISFVLSFHEDIPQGTVIDTCHANGDCNNDGIGLTVPDADCLFQYLYHMGPAPDPLYKCDLNGDCVVDQADLDVYQAYFVYGISYFDQFGGYPVPTCCDEVWTYSRPGPTLWEREVTEFTITQFDPPSMEGWYDPNTSEVLWNNQQHYFQYDICFDPEDTALFAQDSGTIYWLNISAIVADPQNTTWGWKSTQDHWHDDAVWGLWGELNWIDMWEPTLPLTNGFFISMDEVGNFLGGQGENAYGDGWYYYPQSEWWNIWFYDHPLSENRRKRGFIEFDVTPLDPVYPMSMEVAVNWSTELWTIDNPDDSMPPLPGESEGLYIGREILWATEYWEGHVGPLYYEISEFNPEWVSVDIRGFNYDIPTGIIQHECQASLDLAFVITGVPVEVEACCFPDGGCDTYPPDECMSLGGLPLGPGTVCSVQRACCMEDGTCQVTDTLCCLALGGTPIDSLTCGGDLNVNGTDDYCETSWGACCLPEGDCETMSQTDCDIIGGEYEGDYVLCLGDANQNGVNDQCDTWFPQDPFKMHFPQTPDGGGWDVSSTWPEIIADDWMCSASGPVTDIHFWGSWLANDNGSITAFYLRIYEDVPADVDLPYSHPGEMLWEYRTGEYNMRSMLPETQGWYDPHQGGYMQGDHTGYFQYDVYIPESDQFNQEEGTIYWLSVSAVLVEPSTTHWGWKSSTEHWNDNAANLAANWMEMYEPVEFTEPLDLSFVIGGLESCDCIPGDANGDCWPPPPLPCLPNVGDAVYVINYVFKAGPGPVPYPICSGDANCDCQANVGDAVYIINYVFKGGPPPCECLTWLSNCGPPLRK